MAETGIGSDIKRREDFRFLKGVGRYIDDIDLPNQAYMYLLRSGSAHALPHGNSSATAAASVVTQLNVLCFITGTPPRTETRVRTARWGCDNSWVAVLKGAETNSSARRNVRYGAVCAVDFRDDADSCFP